VLKKLVGNEEQWPWVIEHAKTLMRHFADMRAIDRLGDQADFSLSHGAVQLAAEQALADIGTFEAEKAANAKILDLDAARKCPFGLTSENAANSDNARQRRQLMARHSLQAATVRPKPSTCPVQ
jgi:hypothetical protein